MSVFQTTSKCIIGVVKIEIAIFCDFNFSLYFPHGILTFFWCSDANVHLNTQNCREKPKNKVAPTHLELRSPMCGEFWVWFFLCGLEGIDDFAVGFM